MSQIELGIGDERVALGQHLAYLWETEAEFREGVGFLFRGLLGDDYGVIFGHRGANERVLAVLREQGMDIEGLLMSGRLTVMQGSEDAGAMLAGIGASFASYVAKRGRAIRLLGNLGWGLADWPDEREILAFEEKVTQAARLFPCVVLCMYDAKVVSERRVTQDAYEGHPQLVRRGVVRGNAYRIATGE